MFFFSRSGEAQGIGQITCYQGNIIILSGGGLWWGVGRNTRVTTFGWLELAKHIYHQSESE